MALSNLASIRVPLNLNGSRKTLEEHLVGAASDNLRRELLGLYWKGVKRELRYILKTLRKWQQPEYATLSFREEEENTIYGFENFLNQVSQSSREFAIRYEET